MFLLGSSPKAADMHFVSCWADGAECHPIGLVELWPGQLGLEKLRQGLGRKAVGESVAGGVALRRPSAVSSCKASLSIRTAADGFCMRSRKFASAIRMQARNSVRSRPPCGAAAHTV